MCFGMNIYPLLETLSKVGSNDSLKGLLRGELNAAKDHDRGSEYVDKLQQAVDLLEEAKSIEDFLKAANKL